MARASKVRGGRQHAIALVRDAVRLSAHVVERDPSQLAGQLLGRLAITEAAALVPLLQEARLDGRLLPLHPTLSRPGGGLVGTLAGHDHAVTALEPLDAGRVISGSSSGTLRVWNVERGDCLETLNGHAEVTALVVLDAGRAVAASAEGRVFVWDLEKGERTTLFATTGVHIHTLLALDARLVISVRVELSADCLRRRKRRITPFDGSLR